MQTYRNCASAHTTRRVSVQNFLHTVCMRMHEEHIYRIGNLTPTDPIRTPTPQFALDRIFKMVYANRLLNSPLWISSSSSSSLSHIHPLIDKTVFTFSAYLSVRFFFRPVKTPLFFAFKNINLPYSQKCHFSAWICICMKAQYVFNLLICMHWFVKFFPRVKDQCEQCGAV